MKNAMSGMLFGKLRFVEVQEDIGKHRTYHVISLNHHIYKIEEHALQSVLRRYGIHLIEEERNARIPHIRIDNRPLWQKDLDMRMGRATTFRKGTNYQEIDGTNLFRQLEKIRKDYEREFERE